MSIDNDTLIICATARLARSLNAVQQRRQMQSGKQQWQAQNINTLALWLNATIETAMLQGDIDTNSAPTHALNATQEGLLWEQSIHYALKQNAAVALFDTSGLASAAMEANRLLIEWNLSLDTAHATEETRQFLVWRQRFQSLCRSANSLEAVRYNSWQLDCLAQGAGNLPQSIQLAGFDRINPQLQRLIDILQARGVRISLYANAFETAQQLAHYSFSEQDAECRAAVAWAQTQLQQNPQAKLAIVVPELELLRDKLSALLDETFHPDSLLPSFYEMPRCYDFSLGLALSAKPIVNTALDLLRIAWQGRALSQADVSRLVLSPYWSASQFEADARAQLDARMRGQLPLSFNLSRLTHFVQQHLTHESAPINIKQLNADLHALVDLAKQHTRIQPPSFWTMIFKQALQVTHWPGERSLSSHEYQARLSFERALAQLAELDHLLGKISPNEAIKRLTQLVQAQIFQPESQGQPTLQVMGMLEASAEPLDAMWVMGMNDHVWPPIARTNALIPAELQRQAGTPNASSEVQTAFAQAVHQRLIKSAKQVIFSSSEKDGERLLRMSPLMLDIAQEVEHDFALIPTLAEKLAEESHQDWQWLDDAQAPPVLSGEHVSGGTALLKAQAICPAWAFYQYRLGARQLDEPSNGLDVMERGNLVHAVLAQFWQNQSSVEVKNLSEQALKDILNTIAQQVMLAFNQEHGTVFSEVFLALEAERLSKLVYAWIVDVELSRPQDFSVTACEQAFKASIEDISIKLVIDRIDTLDDGRLVLIDYKTGRNMDYKNWADAQITEPQLPIYAAFLLEGADIAAVCFAKVRSAEHAFVGIAASDDCVPGAVVFDDKKGRKIFAESSFPNWDSIIQHWQTSITATAQALKAGDAAVIFNDEKQLAYCEVLALLRLPERQLQFEKKYAIEL